jgi:hypothetical protein
MTRVRRAATAGDTVQYDIAAQQRDWRAPLRYDEASSTAS